MSQTVLIVDDAAFIREVLKSILQKAGIMIAGEAEDGEQAIRRSLKLKPDTILMDIVMPKVSGIEAAKQILEKLPDTRIIACSTMDQEIMIARALEAGCVDYITKPFEKEKVIRAIRGG